MKRIAILLLSAVSYQLSAIAQGSLTPPGPPAPTFKTLQQVEPRTPVTNLPYTISQPGSYYVTTNLTSSSSGINVTANNVTLDLNGFALIGLGTGNGISMSGLNRSNICVKNGMLRNWFNGMDVSVVTLGQLEQLRVDSNSGYGLAIGDSFLVKDCISSSNVLDGISAQTNCRITDCEANNNKRNGIACGTGSALSGCTTSGNGSSGIAGGGQGYLIKNCTVLGNGSIGISVGNNCAINGCVSTFNGSTGIVTSVSCSVVGCTVATNTLVGISVGDRSSVEGCTVAENQADGIVVNSRCRVVNNMIAGNGTTGGGNAGIKANGSGNVIDGNSIIGNIGVGARGDPFSGQATITRNLFIGNSVGPILFPGAGTVLGPPVSSGNGIDSFGTITNNNPWANIEE